MTGRLTTSVPNLLAAFYASSRIARPLHSSPMRLAPDAAAGLLLHVSSGPAAALVLLESMPNDETWRVAEMYLRAAEEDARAAALPRASGDGR